MDQLSHLGLALQALPVSLSCGKRHFVASVFSLVLKEYQILRFCCQKTSAAVLITDQALECRVSL